MKSRYTVNTLIQPLICIVVSLCFWGSVASFCKHLYPLPQVHAAQDLGAFLDPAYRLLQGQMPHRDYISFLGPLFAAITTVPIYLSGAYYDSYTLYPVGLGLAFSIIAMLSALPKLPLAMAVAFGIFVGLAAGGTYQIGNPAEWLSFATNYNRIGFSLYCIVALVSLSHPLKEESGMEVCSGIIAGALTGALLFFKFNFFVVSTGTLACGFVLAFPRARFQFALISLASLLVAVIIGFTAISWNVQGFVRDIQLIAAARSEGFTSSSYWIPWTILFSNGGILAFAALFVFALAARQSYYGVLGALCAFAGTYVIGVSQSSGSGFGLPGFIASFFVAASWLSVSPKQQEPTLHRTVEILVWGISLVMGIWFIALPQRASFTEWARISATITDQYGPPKRNPRDRLSTLIVGERNTWGQCYMPLLNEARTLAATHIGSNQTLQFVEFTNPVNFAGVFPSAKGQFMHVDNGVNLTKSHPVEPEMVFAHTDYLLISKRPMVVEPLKVWWEVYGDYVSKHYSNAAETENFTLLRKQDAF